MSMRCVSVEGNISCQLPQTKKFSISSTENKFFTFELEQKHFCKDFHFSFLKATNQLFKDSIKPL